MKSFKQHIDEEHILQFLSRSDIADTIKDRHWANHWGYTELPDGNYQHFTRVGAILTPDYLRRWRENGAHIDSKKEKNEIV